LAAHQIPTLGELRKDGKLVLELGSRYLDSKYGAQRIQRHRAGEVQEILQKRDIFQTNDVSWLSRGWGTPRLPL